MRGKRTSQIGRKDGKVKYGGKKEEIGVQYEGKS